jgi:hypothetical protein
MTSLKKIISFSFIVLALSGCAVTNPVVENKVSAATKIESVEMRAQQRWDFLLKGEHEKAYSYLTATSRESVSIEQFKVRNKAAYWKSIKVKESQCDTSSCTVTLDMVYDLRDVTGLKRELKEIWVNTGANWEMVYTARINAG